MDNVPKESVVEKCLELLNLKNFRHPYADHGSKKLLTGPAIMLLVEAEIRKHKSLSYIEKNLRSSPAIQKLTGLDSVHGSTVNRKIEHLPFDLLQKLSEDIFQMIDNHYTEKNPITSQLGRLSIVDSSQIALPSKAGEWAYCTKDSNTIKIHVKLACINDKITFPKKVIFSTGAVDDKEVVLQLVTDKDTTYVFDRGYIHYHNFHSWKTEGFKFVARVKANSKLRVLETRPTEEGSFIKLDADVEVKDPKTKEFFTLRLVEYQDQQKRPYRVVTDRWDLSDQEIADIYKRRWLIEIFFKWIKQNLNTIKLYCYKPEAVWNQICIALIAYGLVELVKIQTKTTRCNREIVELLRIYWEKKWYEFLEELFRVPSRKSKGRRKKGKPGRPRKYPKKMKAQKIIINK
jgi:transposase